MISMIISYFNKVTTRFTSKEQKAYATAGALAEEVLSSIKTVIAFGGEYKESDRYGSSRRERWCYLYPLQVHWLPH